MTPERDELSTATPRFWQFSVRSVLIALTLLCLGVGIYFAPILRHRAYQAEWASMGFDLNINAAGHDEVRTLQSYRSFDTFPLVILELPNLTALMISNSQLEPIPPEIGQLNKLTTLWLPADQLVTLPAEIGQLTLLEDLCLNANQLTQLPPEIGRLTKLKELQLQKNQLASLPNEFKNLTSLTQLWLAENPLTDSDLIPLKKLNKLVLLDIRGTQITARAVADFKRALPNCVIFNDYE